MNINVYLEDDLHEAVAKHAAKHNVSKNSVIRDAIREMVMDDAPYSMKEGQSSFSHSEPIEDFSFLLLTIFVLFFVEEHHPGVSVRHEYHFPN